MNFPHLETQSGGFANRGDYRAFLSSAISRQGDSDTARRMMIASQNKKPDSLTPEFSISERIRYFAARSGRFVQECAPHGAFFPTIEPENMKKSTYEDAVYQDASMNCKDQLLSTTLSATQITMSGQENSRTL